MYLCMYVFIYVCVWPKDQRKGRKVKNEVVGEKVVNFDFPRNFDVASFKDKSKIQERLGKWRIQRRQRETKMIDTVNNIVYIKTYVMYFQKKY